MRVKRVLNEMWRVSCTVYLNRGQMETLDAFIKANNATPVGIEDYRVSKDTCMALIVIRGLNDYKKENTK